MDTDRRDDDGVVGPGAPSRPSRARRRRSHVATLLAVLLTFTLTGGLFAGWAETALFDEDSFSNRAVKLLDSSAVREELADAITEALVTNGPSQVASFQAIIRPVLADIIETPAFKEIFRNSVREAHRAMFTEDGAAAVVNLSQAIGVLASSLQISNPDVADHLPSGADQFLVDFSDQIRNRELWRTGEDLDQMAETLLALSVVLGVAVVVVAGDGRAGVFRVGVAAVVSGALLGGVTVLAPHLPGIWVADPLLAEAVASALEIFLGDLQALGVWVIAYGVVAAALVTASKPQHQAVDVREVWSRARARALAWQPETPAGRVLRAAVVIAAGLVLVVQRDVVVPLAVAAAGAYVAYLGILMLLATVGRPAEEPATGDAGADRSQGGLGGAWGRRLAGAGLTLVVLVTVVGAGGTVWARGRAQGSDERACNGHVELCDRRLDEVAFAGSHNSMSAARDAGWLFPEQTYGIPAQLQYGVRALLVKTHYGIPSGIDVTGAELIITDRAAELAVNPAAAEAQLPGGSAEQAEQLANSASAQIDPAKRDVFLCHVYCEYGATRFVTALTYVKQFLDRNPNEVVILFIGDYVSKDDTAKAFQDAGLYDRLWEYDPTQPAPTLGEMIDAGRNVLYLAEFSDTPPAWNNPGYGLFQDTPYTFRGASGLYVQGAGSDASVPVNTAVVTDTTILADAGTPSSTSIVWGDDWTGEPSCAPNRGSPVSPLFQINHWVTPSGAAPTTAQAQEVNAYDVLMPRVEACMGERGRFPTIVGVNFYDQGDLLRVVNEINGIT